MPGNAGSHLAPHNRHPQLVTDHRPRGDLWTATRLSARHGPSTGTGLDAGTGLCASAGLGGKDLNLGESPVQCSSGGLRLRAAGVAGRRLTPSLPLAVAVVAQFGKPPAHLEHAGVIWPNVGLHLSPSFPQGVSAEQPPFTCRPGRTPRCGSTGRPLYVGCARPWWCPSRLAATGRAAVMPPGQAACPKRARLTSHLCPPWHTPSPTGPGGLHLLLNSPDLRSRARITVR
jgi:hypothetical protein